MPDVIVAGGGLAGMAAGVALASAGCRVTLLEARGFLGGRASSFENIDNCQHILLRCCRNLLDFYHRLGVEDQIRFYREFHFLEPSGRLSRLAMGPLHLAGSFAGLPFLSTRAKLAVGWGLAAVRREYGRRQDLDRITMLDWLTEKRQPGDAIAHFWRPVLVSAVNSELDVMAAGHGLQVFRLAFLGAAGSHEMGVPAVPLQKLYAGVPTERLKVRFRSSVDRIGHDGVDVGGKRLQADYYVCALPLDRVSAVAPGLNLDLSAFRHSPITGIHLWFDRSITELPHASLLDRTIQWLFNKDGGRYVHVVVSASTSLVPMTQEQVVDLTLRELGEFFPRVREAGLERARVVKELRATFAPAPGLETARPATRTPFKNLFLAGDWTRTGWPSTMEGAVRSGYLAAEAITADLGAPRRFLLPDPA